MATRSSDADKLKEETITEICPNTRNVDKARNVKLRELNLRSDARK